MKHEDYRTWVREAFKARVENNPRYSLRAFARDVKLSPASVSLLFNGRKGLSDSSAERIAKHLGLSDDELKFFLKLVRSSRNKNKRESFN